MSGLQVGLDLGSLRMPLRQAIRFAAELGVDAVELDATGEIGPGRLSQTGLRDLRNMLDDCRLRVAALGFRTRMGYDTPIELDSRVMATKQSMELAYQLGARVIVNHIGRIPSDDDSPQWTLLTEILADIGRHGQHVGVMLAAETGPDDVPAWLRLLGSLPEETLGLDLNPGNLLAMGHSATEFVEQLGHAVRHVHATDGLCDPVRRNGQLVALGHGAADFPALLSLLQEHGYSGCFTIQCSSGADQRAEAAHSVKFLRRF